MMGNDQLAVLNTYLQESPLHQWLGCTLTHVNVNRGEVKLLLPLRPELRGAANADHAHGGIVAAFVDLAAHACLHAHTGIGMPTIDLRVDFLRPATLPLTATAAARRVGRTIGVAEVEVFSRDNRSCALGRVVYLVQAKT